GKVEPLKTRTLYELAYKQGYEPARLHVAKFRCVEGGNAISSKKVGEDVEEDECINLIYKGNTRLGINIRSGSMELALRRLSIGSRELVDSRWEILGDLLWLDKVKRPRYDRLIDEAKLYFGAQQYDLNAEQVSYGTYASREK